jgi:hypothetical protein
MGQNLVNMDKNRNIPPISSSLTSLSYEKHNILFDFIVLQEAQIMKILILQFCPIFCYFLSLLSGPDILLSTLFSKALYFCSFLRMRDQVLKPYKTALCILIFTFLYRRQEAKDSK